MSNDLARLADRLDTQSAQLDERTDLPAGTVRTMIEAADELRHYQDLVDQILVGAEHAKLYAAARSADNRP